MHRAGRRPFRPGSRTPLQLSSLIALWVFSLRLCVVHAAIAPDRPIVELRTNHLVLTKSCRLVIAPDVVFGEPEGTGVIQIGASDIEIEFINHSVLRGSPLQTAPDQYKGYGILINGHTGVTIRGARISGFWCGILATKANGLVLEDIDASDNRRARLKSTPEAEDESDWLFGHENDQHQWLTNYAAAIYVEQSSNVVVRDCHVWHGQNALCLDRVTDSRIYDNDFSFDSGWGIALWRSSGNVISRNAVDFCVRGYSHGVYNRGQDSAGIFMFEQNNRNIVAENSVTHGGDGFFGFAGREAIGEEGEHSVEWYRRRGNSDNILFRNDFSYAAAHGIENTFSFGNQYLENRIVGNAICGVWAGYSRETLIARNHIEANGEMGYGLERGGIDIDHGGDNIILQNLFLTNKCGVHLWGGANPEFEKRKWAHANGYASTGSVVGGNTFRGDDLAFQFRGPGEVTLISNRLEGVAREMQDEPAYKVNQRDTDPLPSNQIPSIPALGHNHPVGARPQWRGRENIIMTEWGPWDHMTPLVRLRKVTGGTAVYEVLKVPVDRLTVKVDGPNVHAALTPVAGKKDEAVITVKSIEPGFYPYRLNVAFDGKPLAHETGTLLDTRWETTFFCWPTNADPRQHLEAYRRLATESSAVSDVVEGLNFKFGMRSPSALQISKKISDAKLPQHHFGLVARTRLPLPTGKWQIKTESDDGVRVSVDGKPVIENWTWHGPTRDTGSFSVESPRTVEITVEYFQIDGYAVLDFALEPAPK